MSFVALSVFDLSFAAALVVLLAFLTWKLETGQSRSMLIAAARTVVQLLLLGFVLETLFATAWWGYTLLIMLFMALVAGYEVTARQKRRFKGWWGYGLGTVTMFISTFSVLLLTLLVMVQPEPWYRPQYAIPLFGMLLGNSMTGIALALDRLTDAVWVQRAAVEARLMLGVGWQEAIRDNQTEALRSGLMPMINAMAAAGVVSLPGMMTGQILGGSPPLEAAKYQILIMFLITIASGIGTILAVRIGGRRLFDERERLALDRLSQPK